MFLILLNFSAAVIQIPCIMSSLQSVDHGMITIHSVLMIANVAFVGIGMARRIKGTTRHIKP